MQAKALGLPDLYVFEALQFPDHRGNYVLWYEQETFEKAIGYPLTVAKTHHAVSRKDTIRGIHYTALPPGQGKYVYCARGRLYDVIVDLRWGSPTFGRSVSVELDDRDFKALYIPVGFGHGYAALEDDSVLVYLCTTPYSPEDEVAVNPFDERLAIAWPPIAEPVLSERDKVAPSLSEVHDAGLLPDYDFCLTWYAALRDGSPLPA